MYSQNDFLIQKLENFFNNKKNFQIMYNIINKNNTITKRFLDWFITKYCKNNIIHYKIKDKYFCIYKEYKSVLKGLNKTKFDPFCRITKNMTIYTIDNSEGKLIEASLAQMNFFKWIIENQIDQYITQNINYLQSEFLKIKNI